MKAMTILLREAKAQDSGKPEDISLCSTEMELEKVGVQPSWGHPFKVDVGDASGF